MALFGKKQPSPAQSQAAPSSPLQPVEQVAAMKQQGYTNSQIIASLQRDGFTSSQIFDALNQVEMRMGMPIDGSSPPEYTPQEMAQQQGQPQQPIGMSYQYPSPPPMQAQASEQMVSQMPPPSGMGQQQIPLTNDTAVEEIVESIIDEKWNELLKDFNKVIDWKNSTEARIIAMEQQVKDLKEQFERLHSGVLGKITDYDKNIQDVGAEIKAMEKVFSKVLPAFTDTVSELESITEKMKAGSRGK